VDTPKQNVSFQQNSYLCATDFNVAVWTTRPHAGRIQPPLGAPLDRDRRPRRHGNLEAASSQPDVTDCVLMVARRGPSFCSIRTD
jgi:hypothetical protein